MHTITDVLAVLRDEHDEQYVYRGQTHRHPSLLPSALRGYAAIIDEAATHLTTSGQYAGLSRRAVEQERFRHFLTTRLGPGLGSLFAQQYGMSSTVIDVTSSVDVAAFFATRRWPTYEHQADGQGRIYRWRKVDPPREPAEVIGDAAVGHYVKMDDPSETRVPALARRVLPGSAEALLPLDEQDGWFIMPSTIFTVDEVRRAVAEFDADGAAWMLDGFGSSRWAAQQGGFLRPEIRYPAHLGPRPDGGLRLVDRPDLAGPVLNAEVTIGTPDAVTDAAQIGPPDVFDFVHGPTSVPVDASDLWPSVHDDPLFEYCAVLVWTASADYFDQCRANTPWDFSTGLLDRGPYRFDLSRPVPIEVWPDVEAADQAEHAVFEALKANRRSGFGL